MYLKYIFCFQLIILVPNIFAQSNSSPHSLLRNAALENCVQYAIEHQPAIQQSLNNENIIDQEISITRIAYGSKRLAELEGREAGEEK